MTDELAENAPVLQHPRVHALERTRVLGRDALRKARPQLHHVPRVQLLLVVLMDVEREMRVRRGVNETRRD